MKQLNEYETPLTDAAEIRYDDISERKFALNYFVLGDEVRFIERKLAMCRDALAEVVSNYNGQMDCLDGTIKDVKTALEKTK